MSYTDRESSEKHNMMPVNLFRCQCSRRRVLRGNPVIRQDYTYFNWTDVNGAGRLKQITSGIMSDLDSPHKTGAGRLQDLRYTYDENGNVLTIKDYKADNPQTQSFSYDELDRLSSGRADNAAGIEMERDGGSINSIDGTYVYETYTYNNSTGNLYTKAGVSYTYGDSSHKHAVTATGSDTYTYDANGNQITRNVGGSSYTLSYDAENRLVSVSGAVTATFVYDGDGNRVKGTISGNTSVYLGNYFEWTGSTSTMKKYYYAGSIKVAMRTGSSTLNFLLGDHLGSNAITTSSSGVKNSEIRYMPWGTTRYTSGTSPTTYQYTGQRVEASLGLLFYNARWYDPYLARFIQADTIVPGGVQGLDRYAYVGNNPVNYVDPSGHVICSDDGYCGNLNDTQYQTHMYKEAISDFNWSLTGRWTLNELKTIYQTGADISSAVGGIDNMKKLFGNVNFEKKVMNDSGQGGAHHVLLNSDSNNWGKWTIAHELGHSWDALSGWKNSRELEKISGGYTIIFQGILFRFGLSGCESDLITGCNYAGYYFDGMPAKGSNLLFNRKEDFAETFAAFIYPKEAQEFITNNAISQPEWNQYSYDNYLMTPRGLWISDLIYLSTR